MSDSSEPVSAQHAKIFISYRRDDCAGHVGRLYDRLCDRFGQVRIFMDIDSIEPGEDFVQVIDKTVSSCEILLAVIGQKWLTSSIEGKRRLDNAEDFVRLEIATALRREIRVIPVLVQGASMPSAEDLPDELKRLVRRNFLSVDDLNWRAGVDRLISTMEKIVEKPASQQPVVRAEKIVPPPAEVGVSPSERRTSDSPSIPHRRSPPVKYLVGSLFVAVIVAALIYSQSRSPSRVSEAADVPKITPLPAPAVDVKGSPVVNPANAPPDAVEPTLDAFRRSITVRAGRSDKPTDTAPDGRTRHLYSIWIDAPPEIISKIAKVLYHYDHYQFDVPRTESSNANDNFRDSYNGIGAVNADMDIIVVLHDGREIPFKFNMYQAVFGNGTGTGK